MWTAKTFSGGYQLLFVGMSRIKARSAGTGPASDGEKTLELFVPENSRRISDAHHNHPCRVALPSEYPHGKQRAGTADGGMCIMALNGAALSLYFHASAYYYDEAVQQAGFAEKAISKAGYIRSVTASVNDLRIFRHDMANHFTVLEHYLKEGNAKKSLDYLQRMARQCRNQEDIKTGS